MDVFTSVLVINDLFIITSAIISFSILSVAFSAVDYIQILVYIELAILCVNLNFVYISVVLDDIIGQVFVVFILSILAAESAISLSIFIIFYRLFGSVSRVF